MKIAKKLAIPVIIFILGLAVGAVFLGNLHLPDPVPTGACTAPPQGPDWMNLLDEAHATGWKNTTDDKDIFEIVDGVLHIYGRMIPPLRYAGYAAERFGDFALHLEFKVDDGANSGVFLRAQPNDPVHRGFEIQVLDDHGKAPSKNGSGSIYDVATPMYNMALPAGEWNSYDIEVRGGEVDVHMNGWRVVHTDLSKMTMKIGKYKAPFAELPAEGNLLLQDHGGEAWYRNIYLRAL